MLSDKPRLGIALSLVAGILMLIVLVGSILRAIYPILSIELLEYWYWSEWRLPVVLRLCFVVGWAVLILIGALVLYIKPEQHSLGRVIILASSALTLLLWVGGFILRYTREVYHELIMIGRFEFPLFDVLAVASILGIIGGTSGVLWNKRSAVSSVKKSEVKLNLLGVASAILAFSSLALPWWVLHMGKYSYVLFFPWGTEELVGSGLLFVWNKLGNYALAIYVALAFILISGILVLVGSLMVGKRGRMLLVAAGISAVLYIATFAGGLESFLIHWHSGGHPRTFYIDSVWLAYLSFGFWTALVAAILAFVASLKHPLIPSKTVSSQEMQA